MSKEKNPARPGAGQEVPVEPTLCPPWCASGQSDGACNFPEHVSWQWSIRHQPRTVFVNLVVDHIGETSVVYTFRVLSAESTVRSLAAGLLRMADLAEDGTRG